MRVGFCGLGKMGGPMAQRVVAAGHRVAVWNRSYDKAQAFVQEAATSSCIACETPRDVAARSDIVLLCLADGNAVEDVAFGADGLASGVTAAAALTIVDHSTLAPSQARSLASRWQSAIADGAWVDAPVSGGVAGAAAGTLAIMAGGEAERIAAIERVLAAFAARVTRMGESGAGQATKLVNQIIVMTTIAAIAEGTLLARHGGIDTARIPTALAGGWADSVLLQTLQPRMVVPPQQPSGSIRTMLKDLNAINEFATECGIVLPIASRVRDWLTRAVDDGLGDADISQIVLASVE
ncbi:NAD(P)-dependent oxidoreductase [Burkholderia sp. Ac-20365]|nr:NAD(P)-dependent oxidoreductase [Burkholderia sp. Ac-20365]MBN3760698.1 NAD(P)-dependent oxidoreductase [Burkholderia sp. Ac-20365]